MPSMLTVPFHQQNTKKYCGAACAQMVLTALGRNVSTLSQTALYTKSHVSPSGATGWYSYPDGLVAALNAKWQDAQGLRFLLHECATKDRLLEIVRETIENSAGHHAGPIVATGRSDHWVVVKGIELDAAASITGLHLNNPLPARNSGANWLHAGTDDCGSGRNKDWPCYYVSLAFWSSNMMRGIQEAGPWQGKFLTICLSPNPGDGSDRVVVPASAAPPANGAPPASPVRTPAEISESVERLLAANPFAGVDCLNVALAGSTPGAPLFVQGVNEDGTEDPSEAYYIVPFSREGDVGDHDGENQMGTQVPLLVTFNAYTGEFEEAVGMPEGTTYDAEWLDPEFVAARSERDKVRQRESDRSGPAFPYRLVWRPTFATPTRFWPLLDGEREGSFDNNEPVYTRIDGEEITELEPLHG